MNVLGVNCSLHDISVALMVDNKLAMAIEEERLSRNKHQGGILLNGIMPQKSLHMIYEKFKGLNIDYFSYCGDIFFQPTYLTTYCSTQMSYIKQLDPTLERSFFVDHHLCHALAAFAESGFTQSVVIVVDGAGDACSTSIWKISNGDIAPILKFPPTSSLGNMYSYITHKLGFHNFGDEGKVMALADYGKACDDYYDLVAFNGNYYEINFQKLMEFGKQAMCAIRFEDKANIAATLQRVLETAMIWLTNLAIRLTHCGDVCITGGVAYNCKSNYHIWATNTAMRLFVPSMPGDSGNSIGAALYPLISGGKYDNYSISPYVGSSYTTKDIIEILHETHLRFTIENEIADAVAKILAEQNMVFLFSGKMEFGPRALGNRSILAPITLQGVSEYINFHIKHREPWRPFAPAILSEFMPEYFENPIDSPYMSFAQRIKQIYRDTLKEVSSIDGSARVQTVRQNQDSMLYEILTKYYQLTKIPILLNTSFNDKNQPIVESIHDALKMFFTSPAKYLILENIIVHK